MPARLIKGKKRHCSLGVGYARLLLHGIDRRTDVQDRDGGLALLVTNGLFPILHCSPTAPIRGRSFTAPWSSDPPCEPRSSGRIRSGEGFVVQPRRWAKLKVERTIAWLETAAALAKDWENLNRNALAFINKGSTRRLSNRSKTRSTA